MVLVVQKVGAAAEGGFFREGSSMNYGLYLNSEHKTMFTTTQDPARVDLFLKGSTSNELGCKTWL